MHGIHTLLPKYAGLAAAAGCLGELATAGQAGNGGQDRQPLARPMAAGGLWQRCPCQTTGSKLQLQAAQAAGYVRRHKQNCGYCISFRPQTLTEEGEGRGRGRDWMRKHFHSYSPIGLDGKAKAGSSLMTWTAWV
jgi:hypothetical protein